MRVMLGFTVLCLLLSVSGCSRAIYGVPEADWQQMSEQERTRTIDRFNRQEAINEATRSQAEQAQQSVEAARQKAHEFERQCQAMEQQGEASADCKKIRRQRVIWP